MTTLAHDLSSASPPAVGVGTPLEWHDCGYLAGNYSANSATCPNDECRHSGRFHSPNAGCLVETAGEYCPCPLAPVDDWTPEDWTDDGRTIARAAFWPVAYEQRDGLTAAGAMSPA